MIKETNFKIGQIVWYMDSLWAKRGKITRKRTIMHDESQDNTVDYEIGGNWIPDCYIFESKAELKSSIIHSIDNNSPGE